MSVPEGEAVPLAVGNENEVKSEPDEIFDSPD